MQPPFHDLSNPIRNWPLLVQHCMAAYFVMQGSQNACPQRSTSGFCPSFFFSLVSPFFSLLAVAELSPGPLPLLLLGPAGAAALSPPSKGADGLTSPSAPFNSRSTEDPAPAPAAARLVAADTRELPAASADPPAGAEGLGGAGAGRADDAAARAAAAAPAADNGMSKSSKQIGQLLDAYCWLRMAAWSRLIAASFSAHAWRAPQHAGKHGENNA